MAWSPATEILLLDEGMAPWTPTSLREKAQSRLSVERSGTGSASHSNEFLAQFMQDRDMDYDMASSGSPVVSNGTGPTREDARHDVLARPGRQQRHVQG